MLIIRQTKEGQPQVDFACDICGKPIILEGDALNWGLVAWQEGQPPKVVHFDCACKVLGFSYNVCGKPCRSLNGSFQGLLLSDVIIHWLAQLPIGTRLIHEGESFIWKGIEVGCEPSK